MNKTAEQVAELVAAESKYQRAAARWVAQHNVEHHDWSPLQPENPLLDPAYITDVTFKVVGAYAYSEWTQDSGDTGIAYTFWEPYRVNKGKDKGMTKYRKVPYMEIRWYDGMNAGKFIEECVALLDDREEDE